MPTPPPTATTKLLSLSLSGGGHLLPYHLGVGRTLWDHLDRSIITAVAGSSAGAIAAAVITCSPECIDDFAQRFIADRGRGFEHLDRILQETSDTPKLSTPTLHICTTKCHNGSAHVFRFDPASYSRATLLECVRASCTIPRSFHPWDVMSASGPLSYPDSDAILIDGEYHVDGGIAAPAPPSDDGTIRIVVSPISGKGQHRISPRDTSLSLLPWQLRCRGDFYVRPSIQNVIALRVASGATGKRELQSWYDRGIDDALVFVETWNQDVT